VLVLFSTSTLHPFFLFLFYTQLISSKYILSFPFKPSSKYPRYYLCRMCDEADLGVAAAFCSFGFFFKAGTVTYEILESLFRFTYVFDQLFYWSETIVFQNSEYNRRYMAISATRLPHNSLTDFFTSLRKRRRPFWFASTSSSDFTSTFSGRITVLRNFPYYE
jgi:hypothetical protein